MIEVKFIKDFRSKKKDTVAVFYPDIAKGLVIDSKVAKYTDDKRQKKASEYIKKIDALKKTRLKKEEEEAKKRQGRRYVSIEEDKKLLKKQDSKK